MRSLRHVPPLRTLYKRASLADVAEVLGEVIRTGYLVMPEFPVLIGDIGGTNARFALVEEKGAGPRLLSREATARHPDPSSAIRAALAKGGGPAPRSAIVAIAGRIDGPEVRLTNARWVVAGARIGADFG